MDIHVTCGERRIPGALSVSVDFWIPWLKPSDWTYHLTPQMDGAVLNVNMPLVERDTENTVSALVRRAAAGDTRAFETLYRDNVGRMHGTILRLVGMDRSRAEELTQEAFVRAWQKLSSFRHESAFSTWLHRLGVNTALMELRGRRDKESVDAEVLENTAGEVPFCAAERGDLERAVAKLPPRARAVLVLHDVEGWKHEEISNELGMAVGSSKAQLHRARGLLRRALTDRVSDPQKRK